MYPALAGRFLTPGPPGKSLCLTFNSCITQLCISRFKNLILPVSVQFSCSVVSDSLQPHGLQHARLPCPSTTARAYSNSCPSRQWYHPTISSSIGPFSSCLHLSHHQSLFQWVSQLFASGGQNIGASASASVLSMNIQDWFLLGWTGWISLQSKEFSRVFSNHSSKASFFST